MSEFMSFKSVVERDEHIISHADYFTTVRYRNRTYERQEHPNLAAAEQYARRMIEAEPDARFLVYAVQGNSSAWVKNIMRGS